MDAKQVPLRELLASVPADARLFIDDADGKGSRSIPVGRLCQEAAAALAEPVQKPHLFPLQSDRMRIDPVTGDVVIGTPIAEPVQEPVAWSFELAMTRGEHGYADWSGRRVTQFKPNVPEGSIRNLTPLYAALLPRKPLTEEQIDELSRTMVKGNKSVNWLCRAIERAHGIGGQP